MTLREKQLDLAVKISRRACRAHPDAPISERMAAFDAAWAVVSGVDAGDEDWTEETLDAAWNLIVDAWPDGGEPVAVATSLADAHDHVVRAAGRSARRGSPPRRGRRDA